MDFATIWTVTINVLLVILGINALIVVHEWGHFIVARLCGVRCDKFYIWFDFWGLKFFKFKWGDTEYGLGLFPLGGYVKMLGQEDNPGELRAEMERARLAAQQNAAGESPSGENPPSENLSGVGIEKIAPRKSGEAVPVDEGNVSPPRSVEKLKEEIFAPDSYLAKSVPQRLAIIVAGVVMNFLFAIVCATAAYMVGIKEQSPAIGNVVPGSPAWHAGLQAGDKIIAINDSPARVFSDINMAMVGGDNGVKLTIERTPSEFDSQSIPQKLDMTLIPRKRKGDLAPMIGVGPLATLELAPEKKMPVYKDVEKYYSSETLEALKKPKLRIEKVEGVPVTRYTDYLNAQLKKFDQPIQVGFSDGSELVVPAIPLKEIGVRFKMGAIAAVLPGSDAAKKGIKVGDVILSVDDQTDVDPLKLSQILLRKINEGKTSVQLVVKKNNGQEKTLDVELTPERIIPNIGLLSMKDPVGSTALGLAWGIDPIIAGVSEDAPEIAKTLPSGGKVVAIKLLNAQPLLKKSSFTITDKEGVQFPNIGDRVDIPYIFDSWLQETRPVELTEKEKKAGAEEKSLAVRLQIEDEKGYTKTFDIPVYDSKDWFSTDRGFALSPEKSIIKINDFGEALLLGTKKMIDCSCLVYHTLTSLASGKVSPRALGGPVLIVQSIYMVAASGFGPYLMFLCLIGANLAVLNIFPMPPLDGGHVVFLLYEGIFRRPPNEIVQVILSYIGLFLLLVLMVWALSLDFTCIPRL